MKKRLLLLIATMVVIFMVAAACEQTVRTKCDDSMDYRIEAYNDWVDANDPECNKVTREKDKKPWPQGAYDFYEEWMLDMLDLNASKSEIEDCYGELLRDAESCSTLTVDCQEAAWVYLDSVGCLTGDE
jgi:hypothetical protein